MQQYADMHVCNGVQYNVEKWCLQDDVQWGPHNLSNIEGTLLLASKSPAKSVPTGESVYIEIEFFNGAEVGGHA